VDLATLPLLGEVRGYWNIVDYLQQIRGQLLVSVRPDDTLLVQLQAARAGRQPSAAAPPSLAAAAAGLPAAQASPARQGTEGGWPDPEREPQPAAARAEERNPNLAAGQHGGVASSSVTAPAQAVGADSAGSGSGIRASSGTAGSAAAQAAAAPSSSTPGWAAAAAAAGGAGDEDGGSLEAREAPGEPAADALLGELQARMQALQLLSQRLSREATATAGATPATCASGGGGDSAGSSEAGDLGAGAVGSFRGSRRGDSEREGGSEGWLPDGESLRAAGDVRIRTIEASDEEDEGGGLLGRLRHHGRVGGRVSGALAAC
jgi:hypothetical protein